MRAAVVNTQTNLVTNIIVADPDVDACPYEGHFLLAAPDAVQKGFQWTGAGFINPNPPPPPSPENSIPRVITAKQFRLQLKAINKLSLVKTYIQNTDEDTQIYFEYETLFQRDAPQLAAMMSALSITEQQMDDLFTAAAQL